MKVFKLLLVLALLTSCAGEVEITEKDYYIDVNVQVVDKWIAGRNANKYVLIRLVSDTTMYREMRQGHDHGMITTEQWYSWDNGDTLHYDWMGKVNFFKKK